MADSLKQKTISGMIWSGIQRFGTMGIGFISNMVLARLLTPEDFGCMGMVLIFITLSNTFIDAGFGSALIQKNNPTDTDYSSIFYFNIVLSFVLYGLLYLISPLIADYYNIEILTELMRVIGVVLIINAFSIIQYSVLRKRLLFKKLAIINIVSATISTITAIILALLGYGVWTLVIRTILQQALMSFFLWIVIRWRPCLLFSMQSIKSLGKFGGMILMANLVESLYHEIYSIIIGKAFSVKDLGYYTQAKRLEEVPTKSLSMAINQVTYPIYSTIQDNKAQLKNMVRQSIEYVSYFVIPMYALLMIIAKPLIILLFTDKWLASIPLFQILCLCGMVYPQSTINTNVIKSLGRGKLYFNLQLFKRLGAIGLLLFSVRYGLAGLMATMALVAILMFLINAYFTSKLIHYRVKDQLKDMSFPAIVSLLLGLVTYPVSSLSINGNLIMVIQISLFVIGYLLISKCLKINIIEQIIAKYRQR